MHKESLADTWLTRHYSLLQVKRAPLKSSRRPSQLGPAQSFLLSDPEALRCRLSPYAFSLFHRNHVAFMLCAEKARTRRGLAFLSSLGVRVWPPEYGKQVLPALPNHDPRALPPLGACQPLLCAPVSVTPIMLQNNSCKSKNPLTHAYTCMV